MEMRKDKLPSALRIIQQKSKFLRKRKLFSSSVSVTSITENISKLEEDLCSETSEDILNERIVIEKSADGDTLKLRSRLDETDRITPLPKEYLPLSYSKFSSTSLDSDLLPKKHSSWELNKSDQTITRKEIDSARENYVPNSHVKQPFYCRVCRLQFANQLELEQHRKTSSHIKWDRFYLKISYCHLCKKQFNSPEQLKEHQRGKNHLDRMSRRSMNRLDGEIN